MAALTPLIRRAASLQQSATHTFTKRALGGGWIFLILFILFLALAGGGTFAYKRWRASRSNLNANYPAPAPTGIKDWIGDKIASLKRGRNRSNNAGYEPSSRGGRNGGNTGFLGGFGGFGGNSTSSRGPRGGGPFDPDEAWDARVGNEAMFEEQELGLHAPSGYTGAGYGANTGGYAGIGGAAPPGYDEEETRAARSEELDRRYEEEMHGGARGAARRSDPFGDQHAVGQGLRGVSPRPIDTSSSGRGQGHHDDSPTKKKSVFHEEM